MPSSSVILLCTQDPATRETWRVAAHRVVGFCENVSSLKSLRRRLVETPSAVVLLDVEQPELRSRQAVEAFRAEFHDARFLAFCEHCTSEKGRFLVEIGVEGYLPLDAEAAQVARALEQVMAGGMWLPRHLMEDILRGYRKLQGMERGGNMRAELGKLTPRQQAVVKGLLEGLSNKDIAERLSITVRTVKAHVSAILAQTSTRSRAELVSRIGGARGPDNPTVSR